MPEVVRLSAVVTPAQASLLAHVLREEGLDFEVTERLLETRSAFDEAVASFVQYAVWPAVGGLSAKAATATVDAVRAQWKKRFPSGPDIEIEPEDELNDPTIGE
jgi:hypothetical protein